MWCTWDDVLLHSYIIVLVLHKLLMKFHYWTAYVKFNLNIWGWGIAIQSYIIVVISCGFHCSVFVICRFYAESSLPQSTTADSHFGVVHYLNFLFLYRFVFFFNSMLDFLLNKVVISYTYLAYLKEIYIVLIILNYITILLFTFCRFG